MRKQMREATKPRPARAAGRNAPERRFDRLLEFRDLVSAWLERDDAASLMARPRPDTRVNKRG
jgi:hypothetical protein